MQVRVRAVLSGAATFLPVLRNHVCRGTGGSSSARYCYSVWLRHLVYAEQSGCNPLVPTLAELGPGDSLGIGLAAMLSGVDVYLALDAKLHAARQANLAVLDDLIGLFQQRAPVPGEQELPHVQPKLACYDFPHRVLTDQVLEPALRAERLAAIRAALVGRGTGSSQIRIAYLAPWEEASGPARGTVDMVISQAVMEHVEDVPGAYRALFQLLKPGGFMSHNIDFRSHNLTRDWNGHWTVGSGRWALIKGTRPYLINRLPHSAHLEAMADAGFRVAVDVRREGPPIPRAQLAAGFRELSDADLTTEGALILAVKPAPSARSLS